MGFYNSSIYFESKSSSTKKIFTIKFPAEVLHELQWDEEEIKQLAEYERSNRVSDRLKQIAMIARKIEGEDNELTEETDRE